MKSSLLVSAFLAAACVLAATPRDDAGKRANELTLAGLRPGRDSLALAVKHYKAKYDTQAGTDKSADNTADNAAEKTKEWLDPCTGRSLVLDLDAQSIIQEVTVSSLGPRDAACKNARFDALDMKSWVTGHGLRLGDPQDRVTELYGEPGSSGPSVRGDQELEFLYYAFDWAGSDVPQVLEVYCARDSGKVVEITLAYPSL